MAATTSQQFTLNWKDVAKGFLVAAISAALSFVYPLFQSGNYHIDWRVVGGMALTAGIGYLVKNFLTPAQIIIENPPKETVEAVKSGEAEVKIIPK